MDNTHQATNRCGGSIYHSDSSQKKPFASFYFELCWLKPLSSVRIYWKRIPLALNTETDLTNPTIVSLGPPHTAKDFGKPR